MTAPEDGSAASQEQESSSTTNVNITVVEGNNNQVTQPIAVPVADASVRKKWYETAKEIGLYILMHPEWALKWAATLLLLQLFFSNGFSVRTYQEFVNPPSPNPNTSP